MDRWRVYTYVMNGSHGILDTVRTEEVFSFINDSIPFYVFKLFRSRGWELSSSWDPYMDGNTIYFEKRNEKGQMMSVCELRRE